MPTSTKLLFLTLLLAPTSAYQLGGQCSTTCLTTILVVVVTALLVAVVCILADGCRRGREVARDDEATELYVEKRTLKTESPLNALASDRSDTWTANERRRALPEPSAPPEADLDSESLISDDHMDIF